jgi:hypothetical protein
LWANADTQSHEHTSALAHKFGVPALSSRNRIEMAWKDQNLMHQYRDRIAPMHIVAGPRADELD